MQYRIPSLLVVAVPLVALVGLPPLATHDKAAPDAREYVLTVEGMT